MKVTHAAAKSLQLCPTLCNPIDSSPPGSAIPGTLQARTLEWVAIFFSNVWKWKGKVKSLSHVWLNNPMDCSLPGSSVHGIFQARVLEWVAIAFSGKLHICGNKFMSPMSQQLYPDKSESWSSSTLATWCKESTHWKRLWCWERLRAQVPRRGLRWNFESLFTLYFANTF